MMAQIPIISIIVYASILALLLIGSKRAAFGQFNSDSMSLEACKNFQGLAAIGVICHHLSQPASNSAPMAALGQMQIFREIGFLFVAIFFFLSGFGLLKSLQTKPGYLKGFLRRRVLPIVICYYVMNIFYIVFHLILGTKMEASEWICKIVGLALLNDNAWFVPVIVVMYLAFYAAFKDGDRGRSYAIVFLVVAAQAGWFLFNKHFPWWLGEADWWKKPGALWMAPWYKRPVALWYEGEWWVNSTIAFFAGILAAKHEKKLFAFFEKAYWPKLFASILLFASSFVLRFFLQSKNVHYWLEFSGDNRTLPRAMMFGVESLQVLTGLLFIVLLRMKIWSRNRVLDFFGKYSLEFYLCQALFLRAFAILFGWMDKSFRSPENFALQGYGDQGMALLYMLLVFAATIALAIFLKAAVQKILSLFEKSDSKAKNAAA